LSSTNYLKKRSNRPSLLEKDKRMRPKTRIAGIYFIALILLCATTGNAQFTDRYWTFGDSAAIYLTS
jgi:hypothetical protein